MEFKQRDIKMTESELLKRKLFLKNQAIQLITEEIEEIKNKFEGTNGEPIIKIGAMVSGTRDECHSCKTG